MKGFEYLETYRQGFNAGKEEDYVKPVQKEVVEETEVPDFSDEEEEVTETHQPKVSITDKLKAVVSKMFEVEDQIIS
jgi:hypothetical protein